MSPWRGRRPRAREVVRARALLMAATVGEHGYRAGGVGVAGVGSGWRARFAEHGLVKFAQVREGRGRRRDPQQKIDEIVDLTLNTAAGRNPLELADRPRLPGCRNPRCSSCGRRGASNCTGRTLSCPTIEVRGEAGRCRRALSESAGEGDRLCADEKSSVQALDRTQASLPMVKGRGQTMTHDYQRHGTTTLFAALDVLTGIIISQCMPGHRHQEWLKSQDHRPAVPRTCTST